MTARAWDVYRTAPARAHEEVDMSKWFNVLTSGAIAALCLGCTPITGAAGDAAEPEPEKIEGEVEPPAPEVVPGSDRATTEGSLVAEVTPQFRAVMAGHAGELNLMLKLRGVGQPGEQRPRLDLAVVLDRSGSMRGDKIVAVKQAASETLRELEARDRISLYSYDDAVKVHAERRLVDAKTRKRLRTQLLGLEPGGGTALGPALKRSLHMLVGAARGSDVLAHVILFSDGQANVGEQRPQVIGEWAQRAAARGVTVSTVGVGIDYNEDLMTQIAESGVGRYHFVQKPDAVRAVLADEFAGLTATVARDIVLTLRPAEGLRVETVHGYAQEEGSDGSTAARIGSIAAGQQRAILVRLAYGPQKPGALELGEVQVDFRDATADGARRTLTLKPRIRATQDLREMDESEEVEVTIRVAELRAAAALQSASEAVQSRKYEDAKSLLGDAIAQLEAQVARTPSEELDRLLGELREAHAGVDEARRSPIRQKIYLKSNKARAYKKRKK